MLKELNDLLKELEAAVEAGDAKQALHLARRFLRKYRECWPSK